MSSIVGWTPPSFHPDGTLTASEHAPKRNTSITWGGHTVTSPGKRQNGLTHIAEGGGGIARGVAIRGGASEPPAKTTTTENIPSDAAVLQWGQKAPCCAVIFGGLNSMYVNPEIWVLPLRWIEKAVQLSPPNPEPDPQQHEGSGNGRGNRLGFATAVNIKTAGAAAAATVRGRVTPVAAGRKGARETEMVVNAVGGNQAMDGTWRLFQAGGGSVEAGKGKHRRATLPYDLAAEVAGRMPDSPNLYHQQQQQHPLHDMRENFGGEVQGAGGREAGHDRGGMSESAAEIEVSDNHRGWSSCTEEADGEGSKNDTNKALWVLPALIGSRELAIQGRSRCPPTTLDTEA